jgi:hypothetical protein
MCHLLNISPHPTGHSKIIQLGTIPFSGTFSEFIGIGAGWKKNTH